MSVGFGFSAGDFIAALTLVSTVVDALRDSGDSSTEYRELISQLYTLETALINVKRIELDAAQHAEHIALMQAASQCQRTIDVFWVKIKKYQPNLRAGGSGSKVRDGWRKVRWAVCRKEDLRAFKADLMGHTESIEMLLTTVQMAATRIDSKKHDKQNRTMAGKLQESYFGCMQRMNVVLERISTGTEHGKQLLEMTAKVFQTNLQIFQIVVKIQDIITRIPGQIERQQPVFFVDALGRHMAFHLEFVLSAEALTSVLRSNFKNIGPGAKKIDKGEFVIQDSLSKMDVDLASPWETCFRPGQHANMSMVFNSRNAANKSCPKCQDENTDVITKDEDIECRKCTMVYRRCEAIIKLVHAVKGNPHNDIETTFGPRLDVDRVARPKKRLMPHDEENEMALFRRVRIRTKLVKLKSRKATSVSPSLVASLGKYFCRYCGARVDELNFKRHEKKCKQNPDFERVPRFACPYPGCTTTFGRKDNLARHQRAKKHYTTVITIMENLSTPTLRPLPPEDPTDIELHTDSDGRMDVDPDAEKAYNEMIEREKGLMFFEGLPEEQELTEQNLAQRQLEEQEHRDEIDGEAALKDDWMEYDQLPHSESESDIGSDWEYESEVRGFEAD